MDEFAFQAELYALKERLERFTGQRLGTSSSSDHSPSQPNYMAPSFGSLQPNGSSRAAFLPISRTGTPREQPRENPARLENMAGATSQGLSYCPTMEGSMMLLRDQLMELQATTSRIETRLSRLEVSQFTPPASTIGPDGSDAYEYFHAGEGMSSTQGFGMVKEDSLSGVSSSQVPERQPGLEQLVGTPGNWMVPHGAHGALPWPCCGQTQQIPFGNHPQYRDDPFREQRDMLLDRINRLEQDNQRLLRDVTSHSSSGRALGDYHSTYQSSAITSNRVVSGQVDSVDSTLAVELSEQLAMVRAQLGSSEDALAEKKSVINELEEERKTFSSKLDVMSEMKGTMSDDLIYHLKKLARKEDDLADLWRRLHAQNEDNAGLQQQVDEQDNALKIWEQSWNEVNESRLHALRSCEDWESSWHGSQKAIDRLKYEHEANIAALHASCEQKDAQALTQKKIISCGRQQLKDREDEIERLRRALRDVQEDRDCARYVANERRYKLKERDTEISRLKEDLETASVQRSNYAEPEHGESFGNGKAGDEHPSTNYVTYIRGDQRHDAEIPAHERPNTRRASTGVWTPTSDVASDDRAGSGARRLNHWSLGNARSGTSGRRRSPTRQPRQAAREIDWQACGQNNEQRAETVEQGYSPINGGRDRATLRSSLPMKSARQMASEANLHHAFKNAFAHVETRAYRGTIQRRNCALEALCKHMWSRMWRIVEKQRLPPRESWVVKYEYDADMGMVTARKYLRRGVDTQPKYSDVCSPIMPCCGALSQPA